MEAFICKALKGEAIVCYCEPLITQQMEASNSYIYLPWKGFRLASAWINENGFFRAFNLTKVTTHAILLPGNVNLAGNHPENIHRAYIVTVHTTIATSIINMFNRHCSSFLCSEKIRIWGISPLAVQDRVSEKPGPKPLNCRPS